MTNVVMHPAAPEHLPVFITAPGQSDVFMIGCVIFLVLAVVGLGSLYFKLHALPEHLAHGNASKLQFEVVSVLALLGLFTHNNTFWIAALLLAFVPIPDLHAPLVTMAESLAKMAGRLGSSSRTDAPASGAQEEIAWGTPPAETPPPGPIGTGGSHLNDATPQATVNSGHAPSGSAAGKQPRPEHKES
ncbi:hypothetical protein [Arvimicrobium flavum]|uniref:hypothetical protein n=1 Tax=Arvimicrobium flavum TaxID=3393320 RepID=UPI00237B003E|nr:hypothetical protein [Mesorhizobium shangrilense]